MCAAAVDAPAAALIQQHQPDLVVCGHSHKAAHWHAEGVHYINPGSAGEQVVVMVVVCGHTLNGSSAECLAPL